MYGKRRPTVAGVKGPVESERKKLELMCTSLGIDFIDKSDEELREAVQSKMGQKES